MNILMEAYDRQKGVMEGKREKEEEKKGRKEKKSRESES